MRLDHLVRTSSAHPKTAALLRILTEHFQQSRNAGAEPGDVSRVIIFTNLRETVTAICKALCPHEPLLQARSALLPAQLPHFKSTSRQMQVIQGQLVSSPTERGPSVSKASRHHL